MYLILIYFQIVMWGLFGNQNIHFVVKNYHCVNKQEICLVCMAMGKFLNHFEIVVLCIKLEIIPLQPPEPYDSLKFHLV